MTSQARRWTFLFIPLLLGLLCLTGPARAEWQQGEYRITKALYGTSRHNGDVTGRLRQLAQADLRFRLSNGTFGVAPDRGKLKTLRIYAEGPHGPRSFEYTEGNWVNGALFEGWPGGDGAHWGSHARSLRIVYAEYGAGSQRVDSSLSVLNGQSRHVTI